MGCFHAQQQHDRCRLGCVWMGVQDQPWGNTGGVVTSMNPGSKDCTLICFLLMDSTSTNVSATTDPGLWPSHGSSTAISPKNATGNS